MCIQAFFEIVIFGLKMEEDIEIQLMIESKVNMLKLKSFKNKQLICQYNSRIIDFQSTSHFIYNFLIKILQLV